ncbi:MAG: MotA/TolQ/ExbB proton channel family protein [Phycisphaerales bacterium]|nr:MotA/TolQ/ExbB proton channel family protein [Phycisphaerales bacterium]
MFAHSFVSLAQGSPGSAVMDLFRQSFDLFTVLLLLASLAAVTIIIKCLLEVSQRNIAPVEAEGAIRKALADRNTAGLEALLQRDTSFYGHVLRAAHACPGDRGAVRNAAELAAGEQCSKWFRKIEPLNVIGNIGPLLGLAGTVYGMVIAFARLQESAGSATPADLSGGIAKALFHTLLGLLVALPALLVFGLYRSRIDGICTRAMAVSAELVEGYCDLREPVRSNPAGAFNAFAKTT